MVNSWLAPFENVHRVRYKKFTALLDRTSMAAMYDMWPHIVDIYIVALYITGHDHDEIISR